MTRKYAVARAPSKGCAVLLPGDASGQLNRESFFRLRSANKCLGRQACEPQLSQKTRSLTWLSICCRRAGSASVAFTSVRRRFDFCSLWAYRESGYDLAAQWFAKICGIGLSILLFFLIYWILPHNRKVPARAVVPTALRWSGCCGSWQSILYVRSPTPARLLHRLRRTVFTSRSD